MNWAICLLIGLGGCSQYPGLVPLVVQEQRTLAIRPPADIPMGALPAVPAPATVSNPAPKGTSFNLSLDEAIRIALANAEVVRVLTGTTVTSSGRTIYDPAIANTSVDVAKSGFDPVITAKNTFSRAETPVAVFDPTTPLLASIPGSRIDNYELGLGISKKLVTGGTISVDGSLTNSHFVTGPAPLNPQDLSAVTLSMTQPLLQGGGIAANIAPILLARINTERSFYQLKDSAQELVRGVVEGYWSIVFARTDVWAKQQQVEQGEGAYTRAEARKAAGFGSSAEVAQSRVAMYNFRAALVTAEASLLDREAALRNLLRLPPSEPERLVPVTPPTPERFDPKWDEIVRLAEEMRPDLIELNLILEADQQNLIVANNQALPKLDATMFYRWNGLDGTTPTGAKIATAPGQFADWSLGVNFSVPLGLRQGRANLRNAELVLKSDRANLDQGRHNAIYLLAAAYRNLSQFYEQYKAFRETRIAARINLEQQLADFRAGRGIFLNVLQAITDWGNAVSSEAQALALYNTELANLERQTGTILESHSIRFMEERYGSIGPLGRLARPRPYPKSVVPGPNAERYPETGGPPDKNLDKDRPIFKEIPPLPKQQPPVPGAVLEEQRGPELLPVQTGAVVPALLLPKSAPGDGKP